MKRKILFTAIAAGAALLVSFAGRGTGDSGKRGSGIVRVSIDGSSFLAGGSSSDEAASLRRELSRLGVQAPEDLGLPESAGGSNPAFSEKLVASGQPAPVEPSRVPGGLEADHAIRMERDDGTTELILGRADGGSTAAAARLTADRWEPVHPAGNHRLPRMLRKTRGKETSIVWLDEAESSFLLIRRISR